MIRSSDYNFLIFFKPNIVFSEDSKLLNHQRLGPNKPKKRKHHLVLKIEVESAKLLIMTYAFLNYFKTLTLKLYKFSLYAVIHYGMLQNVLLPFVD
jgi:hypothetical protein